MPGAALLLALLPGVFTLPGGPPDAPGPPRERSVHVPLGNVAGVLNENTRQGAEGVAPIPGGARALAAPPPFQPGAVRRGGRLPAPRGAARGPRRQPRLRAGGPGPSLSALGPGSAPLLSDAVLTPGPGARPGAAARGLPRRLLGRLPATAAAPGCCPSRALQLPPAPGLQRLGAVPALPAESLPPPPGSPPDACASDAAAALAVSASGRGVRGRRQRRGPGRRQPPPAHADAAHRGHGAAATPQAVQGRPRPSRAPRAACASPGGPGARAGGGAGVGGLRAGRRAGCWARPRLCAFRLMEEANDQLGRGCPLLRAAGVAPPQGWGAPSKVLRHQPRLEPGPPGLDRPRSTSDLMGPVSASCTSGPRPAPPHTLPPGPQINVWSDLLSFEVCVVVRLAPV
ncbi:collagen alpha-1(III) chain-like [Hyaena hyaena]|uniref:collagen alpha-1(III) chain-like n=1 Tax=Hyaena hyaena TaxID=95912 RepID=UPI001922F1BD|nr:collagen alpha-1(III) chain-like [Hyaena hyaena]